MSVSSADTWTEPYLEIRRGREADWVLLDLFIYKNKTNKKKSLLVLYKAEMFTVKG